MKSIDIMTTLQDRLLAIQDQQYAAFHAHLIPGVSPKSILGIRVPQLRQLVKEYAKE